MQEGITNKTNWRQGKAITKCPKKHFSAQAESKESICRTWLFYISLYIVLSMDCLSMACLCMAALFYGCFIHTALRISSINAINGMLPIISIGKENITIARIHYFLQSAYDLGLNFSDGLRQNLIT